MRRLWMSTFTAAFVLFTAPIAERVASASEPTASPTSLQQTDATHARLRGLLSSSALEKLDVGARALAPQTVTKPAKELRKQATTWVKATWPDSDINAMVFLVLMEAAKSAQEDLNAIMAALEAINDAKAKQREMIEKLQAELAARGGKPKAAKKRAKPLLPTPLKTALGLGYWPAPKIPDLGPLESMTLAELETKLAALRDANDSLAEMSEAQQLRL